MPARRSVPFVSRFRSVHRSIVILVIALALSILILAGGLGTAILLGIQIGLPLWLLARVAQKRLRASRAQLDATNDQSWAWRGANAARAVALRSIATFGGGFYGTMAAAAFLLYQIQELQDVRWFDFTAWEAAVSFLRTSGVQQWVSELSGVLWGMLFGVSTDWIQGFVYAVTWPVHVIDVVGVSGLCVVLIGGLYGFKWARRLVPGFEGLETETRNTSAAAAWTPLGADLLPDRSTNADADAIPSSSKRIPD